MKPFFSFFGGKWRLARHYPAPICGRPVVEPFAGSAGYATFWEPRYAVLVEADPRIAGVWAYLIRTSPEEILRLPDLPVDAAVADLPICQEARDLVGFWLAGARAEPAKKWSAWNRASLGGQFRYSHNPLFWGPRVRARLAEQVPKIRDWRVVFGDYATWLSHPDSQRRLNWFIDPPYTVQGHTYRHHDVDYQALGRWCRELSGQVIVCEGPGAEWLPFEPFRMQLGTNGKNRKPRQQEFWWTNTKWRLHDQCQSPG